MWQHDGVHYFVFELRSDPSSSVGQSPAALFVMHGDGGPPASAFVINAVSGGDVVLTDISHPESEHLRVAREAGITDQS
jgi:hypothetical protein